MSNINQIIHQPTRLNILTILHLDKKVSFSKLKKELNLTDGNLGSHLEKLEKNGYVKIEKLFVDKKPKSTIYIEKKGENELLKYIKNIEKIFNSVKR